MILYKYFSPDRIGVLENLAVRFTPPDELNDPWEARPRLDSILTRDGFESMMREGLKSASPSELRKAALDEIESMISKARAEGIDIPDELMRLMRAQAINLNPEEVISTLTAGMGDLLGHLNTQAAPAMESAMTDALRRNLGILCLTEKMDDPLMWAHYASSHTGFVVGFDAANPFFDRRNDKADILNTVKAVRYMATRPAFSGFSDFPSEEITSELLEITLYSKHNAWAYEKEWRMVSELHSCDSKFMTPEGRAIHLFRFEQQAVCEVIMGCRVSAELESGIRRIVASQFPEAKLLRASIRRNEYALGLDPVS